jgi:hypothetical protein
MWQEKKMVQMIWRGSTYISAGFNHLPGYLVAQDEARGGGGATAHLLFITTEFAFFGSEAQGLAAGFGFVTAWK